MQTARMKMNHIEFVSVLDQMIYEYDFACDGILASFVFAKCPLGRSNQAGFCKGVTTGKQSYLVTSSN